MKNILLILGFTFAFIFSAYSQQNPDREDKIQALYIAYISQQLNLTQDEAKQFWPVHTQYDAELKSISRTQNELDIQQASLNIKKKYQDKFVKILGAERTNNFYKTDAEFRKRMVERLRKLRQDKNN